MTLAATSGYAGSMDKRDRDIVLSRRKAFMVAIAASSLGCGETIVCLSPPHVCLSAPGPRCPDVRFIVFKGTSTSLDAEAQAAMNTFADQAKLHGVMYVQLDVRVFDDGEASAANELHQPRLDAVLAAAKAQGAADQVHARPIDASTLTLTADKWREITGDGNPIPLSGLVLLTC